MLTNPDANPATRNEDSSSKYQNATRIENALNGGSPGSGTWASSISPTVYSQPVLPSAHNVGVVRAEIVHCPPVSGAAIFQARIALSAVKPVGNIKWA